jgi:F0F1-type ATP synthase assembly protein I
MKYVVLIVLVLLAVACAGIWFATQRPEWLVGVVGAVVAALIPQLRGKIFTPIAKNKVFQRRKQMEKWDGK